MPATTSPSFAPSVRSPLAAQYRSSSPRSSHAPATSKSAPMSIPAALRPSPPPPLPPPRYIEEFNTAGEESPSWVSQEVAVAPAPVKSGSSLLVGSHRRQYSGAQRDIDFGSPTAGSPTLTHAFDPSDRQELLSPLALQESSKLQGEKHLGPRSLARSSQAYDKAIVSRIGNPPRSAGGISTDDPTSPSRSQESFKRLNNGQLKPLSLPERHSSEDPSRWTSGALPSPSILSPGLHILRSPLPAQDQERFRNYRSSISSTGGFSATELAVRAQSYDQGMFGDLDQPSDLGITEHSKADHSPALSDMQKAGQKRRAQSPPADSIDPALRPTQGRDAWSRRQSSPQDGRPSQSLRFQDQSIQSLPSTAASSLAQHGSSWNSSVYGASNASTNTNYSADSVHNGGFLNSTISESHPDAASHPGQMHANRAPPIPHRRGGSSGAPRPPGLWICECCPKKPRKFDTEEELRVHEMEKQYYCQYCHNRFKNKNEAERHQNSLHLRQHSWSCAALTSFEAAFHPTTTNSSGISIGGGHGVQAHVYPHQTATDTCGYCGAEFTNPANWDERVQHLNRVHKFGECNQSKKFYRADHFRQHLKHSHAGTSGKWTNMLENACMKDEPPAQPIGQPPAQGGIAVTPPGIGVPSASEFATQQQSHQAPQMSGLPPGYGQPSSYIQSQSTAGAAPGAIPVANMAGGSEKPGEQSHH